MVDPLPHRLCVEACVEGSESAEEGLTVQGIQARDQDEVRVSQLLLQPGHHQAQQEPAHQHVRVHSAQEEGLTVQRVQARHQDEVRVSQLLLQPGHHQAQQEPAHQHVSVYSVQEEGLTVQRVQARHQDEVRVRQLLLQPGHHQAQQEPAQQHLSLFNHQELIKIQINLRACGSGLDPDSIGSVVSVDPILQLGDSSARP
jgi:hypothetical protein